MSSLLERRWWAASWLREQARAVARGVIPLQTFPSVITRALDCGLSHEEVAALLDEANEPPAPDYVRLV